MTDTDIQSYEPPRIQDLGSIAEMTNWESEGSAEPNCWEDETLPGCGSAGSSVGTPLLKY